MVELDIIQVSLGQKLLLQVDQVVEVQELQVVVQVILLQLVQHKVIMEEMETTVVLIMDLEVEEVRLRLEVMEVVELEGRVEPVA